MTIFVNLNIVSASVSPNVSSGRRRRLRQQASATPKITLKTTICSTSPSATDLRDVLREDVQDDVLPRLRAPDAAICSPGGGGGSVMPTPARLMLIAAHPMNSASVVTISK